MSQVRNVIGERRASGAGVLVVGLEHVVIDDQLASPFEHVEKARGPVGPGCLERRIDLGHRQAPTLRRNRVTGVRMCLLGDQQLVAGLSPVLCRHHPWQSRVGMAAHCRCRRHRCLLLVSVIPNQSQISTHRARRDTKNHRRRRRTSSATERSARVSSSGTKFYSVAGVERRAAHLIRSCRLKRRWVGDQTRSSAPRLRRIVRVKTPSSFVSRAGLIGFQTFFWRTSSR